ncbi:RNA polymerase II transcriptional coactivator-like [Trichoplusia ni]|uniref:RNA polymerase II transcriptional coactivator-like n=1 Tax=Trichoplusia ni TaxID=7111 RepID=A0A7E5WI86_TRINI|nr:RNA polymerase II transcriptional coactivator-like [Trichoplusia ni]XP_026740404.1 RNA polymerase II transcriptional coactivator-like [Trichoplusia ni]
MLKAIKNQTSNSVPVEKQNKSYFSVGRQTTVEEPIFNHKMPKNKKKQESSSSSDSDDGPVDRNPPPEKKAKMGNRTDDKEPTWVLQGKKLVKIREFKGKLYIDIREFYEKNGELLPGKKGISMTPEQWRKLMSLGDEINETLSTLC